MVQDGHDHSENVSLSSVTDYPAFQLFLFSLASSAAAWSSSLILVLRINDTSHIKRSVVLVVMFSDADKGDSNGK